MASALRKHVNFTVYQASHHNDMFSLLDGHSNDVFIYDRCGRLAFTIPYPMSSVPRRHVEASILAAHQDNPCGPCLNTEPADLGPGQELVVRGPEQVEEEAKETGRSFRCRCLHSSVPGRSCACHGDLRLCSCDLSPADLHARCRCSRDQHGHRCVCREDLHTSCTCSNLTSTAVQTASTQLSQQRDNQTPKCPK